MIDLTDLRKFDVMELLRPVTGAAAPAGLPPDGNEDARIEGQNILLWMNTIRRQAIALDEDAAGLPPENDSPLDSQESPTKLWNKILTASQLYLRNHGKDLRISFYCMEGLIRRDGLDGVANGVNLLRGLLGSYWEWLHPVPRHDADQDWRRNCLSEFFACNDETAVEYTPLFLALNLYTPVAEADENRYILFDCLADGASRPDPAQVPPHIRATADATEPELAQKWLSAGRRAVEECSAYEQLIAGEAFEKAQIPMPSIRKLKAKLEDIVTLLQDLHGQTQPQAETEDFDADVASPYFPVLERLVERMSANKRSENLRILRALGRCFRDGEPHSPVGYALMHWANLAEKPLPELLDAIGFIDASERGGLEIFTGVKGPRA